jgi:hypothetical protein
LSENLLVSSSVSRRYASSASNRLAAQTEGSPAFARWASRALTPNTSGVTPSNRRA